MKLNTTLEVKSFSGGLAVLGLSLLTADLSTAQVVVPDVDADTVHVQKDCALDGAKLPNCVESIDFLTSPESGWIWRERTPRPSQAHPLVVHVGPGVFPETFHCPNTAADGESTRSGWVSVVGSGRDISQIGAGRPPAWVGVSVENCEHLSFTNLSIEGTVNGVKWVGGGSGSWSDVDIRAARNPDVGSVGWVDTCGGLDPERSRQSFFGSTIRGFGATETLASGAYRSLCAETRFYGGDIQLLLDTPGAGTMDGGGMFGGAVLVGRNARLEVFGSSIRASNEIPLVDRSSTGGDATLYGVTVAAGSDPRARPEFRMHGGIISMNAKIPGDTKLVGLRVLGHPSQPADQTAYANTSGTAFVLNPSGQGIAERIRVVNAQADAPLLWQPGASPPSSANGDLGSSDGQGLFVETDCDASGRCSGGSQSHLMVYDTSCRDGGPWRDVMTNSCRAD